MSKKTMTCTLLLAVLFSVLGISASAVTKADILDAINDSVVGNHYSLDHNGNPQSDQITIIAENMIRTVELTPKEAEFIYKNVMECSNALPVDRGRSGHHYPLSEQLFVMNRLHKCLTMMGYNYAYIDKARPIHPGDQVFRVTDPDTGEILFEFDGDIIKQTGSPGIDSTLILSGLAGILLLAASAGTPVFLRKRFDAEV